MHYLKFSDVEGMRVFVACICVSGVMDLAWIGVFLRHWLGAGGEHEVAGVLALAQLAIKGFLFFILAKRYGFNLNNKLGN
jgi:hypothetical protein